MGEAGRFIYSLAEVAKLTGWSKTALERDIRAGRITHVRRGRSVGLTLDQVSELIARHTVSTPAVDGLAKVHARLRRKQAR